MLERMQERRKEAAARAQTAAVMQRNAEESYVVAIADSGRLIAASIVTAQEAETIHRILFPKLDSGILAPASPAVTHTDDRA